MDMVGESNDNSARIQPVRLELDSKIKFRCHKGVRCFTQCCRGIRILLTPYDVIRLKNRMGISSEDFLAIYTEPQLLEKTDLPVITLKLLDDEAKSCPFVREDGCLMYADRPSTCRYYPLGVASLSHKDSADDEGFFILIEEPHCKGFEEDKVWTIRDWRKDQGVDIDDDINAGWIDLLVRKRSFPKNIALTEKSKQLFFMVSYNIDKFKEFVFNSSFLSRYPLDDETVEKIKNSEIELLRFGMKWLKSILFKDRDLAPAPE